MQDRNPFTLNIGGHSIPGVLLHAINTAEEAQQLLRLDTLDTYMTGRERAEYETILNVSVADLGPLLTLCSTPDAPCVATLENDIGVFSIVSPYSISIEYEWGMDDLHEERAKVTIISSHDVPYAPKPKPTDLKQLSLSLDEVIAGSKRAAERFAKWPKWKQSLSHPQVKMTLEAICGRLCESLGSGISENQGAHEEQEAKVRL